MAVVLFLARYWRYLTPCLLLWLGLILVAMGDDLFLFAWGQAAVIAWPVIQGGGMTGARSPRKDAGEGQ